MAIARIKLTQGKYALVDASDYERLNQWKWQYQHGYAARDKDRKKIFMHRVINQTPVGKETDHINGDKLDNRKSNLRTVTHSQNNIHKGIRPDNTSGIAGVYWEKQRNKWRVRLSLNKKRIDLGFYPTLSEASLARKQGERKYFGEYAYVN